MTGGYEDIISLPHHVSETRPPLSAADRAAQFSPFAALSGFGAAIAEAARLTGERRVPGEDARAALSEKLADLRERQADLPPAAITCFLPDEKKAGGAYVTVSGAVKRVDGTERVVVMSDGTRIPIDDILEIQEEENDRTD